MRTIKALFVIALLALIGGAVAVYMGVYDVAADRPHSAAGAWLLETVRERSVEVRSEHLQVPDLSDPAMLPVGAEHYQAMCAECHLAPGMDDTELRAGLNPRPPNFSRKAEDPAEAFWITKHGIKMSGMPAWGKTHDDETIWAMVALLQRLPELSPAEYAGLTAGAASHDHATHAPGHGHGDETPADDGAHGDHDHDH